MSIAIRCESEDIIKYFNPDIDLSSLKLSRYLTAMYQDVTADGLIAATSSVELYTEENVEMVISEAIDQIQITSIC